MTEIYLYCSITYTNNCNNSYSLKSSFEKMACIQEDFLISMIDPTFSKCTSLHLAKSSGKGFFLILYTTLGFLTGAWLVLPLETATFPPKSGPSHKHPLRPKRSRAEGML